jgi:hypothetical protein
MNPLLLLGIGGATAFVLLRHREAQAAALASAQPFPGMPPTAWPAPMPPPTVVVVPTPSPPFAPQPAPRPAPIAKSPPFMPLLPPQITKPAPVFTGEVAAPTVQLVGRWGWPVPRWQGRAPVISDGFGSPRAGMRHAGVDLMFARVASDPMSRTGPNGTRLFVMPDSWPAVAAADGVLWSAQRTPRGYAVVVDHGNVATFYQHLETLIVPETSPPPNGTPRSQRLPIKAGQPLGVVGGDPMDPGHLKHLHFELWPSGPTSAIDPLPLMRAWEIFTPNDVSRFTPMMARNAAKPARRPDLVSVRGYSRTYPGERMQP